MPLADACNWGFAERQPSRKIGKSYPALIVPGRVARKVAPAVGWLKAGTKGQRDAAASLLEKSGGNCHYLTCSTVGL